MIAFRTPLTSGYDHVTVCTPVWVFGVSAPVRTLLMENRGKVRNARIILTHFQPLLFRTAAIEMCNILNAYSTDVISAEARLGRIRRIRTFRL